MNCVCAWSSPPELGPPPGRAALPSAAFRRASAASAAGEPPSLPSAALRRCPPRKRWHTPSILEGRALPV
eukprot:431114-Pyramimonas_sp.AAC.1